MNEEEGTVTRLCEAFGRMNADELIDYFTLDAVYHNIPLPPLRGRQEIYAFFKGLPQRYQGLRIEVLRQVSAGNVVMNERVDYFDLPSRRIVLPIAGVFEFENGKIKAWREYFDLSTMRRE
jgi:limonene-1,2-epoxide hydrolase